MKPRTWCGVFFFPTSESAMTDRRRFLKASVLGMSSPMLAWAGKLTATTSARMPATSTARVVSTWDFGVAANQAAWAILGKGGHALDAVEAGARVPESDLKNHSVGKGGYPDRDGHVTLDASIMDADGSCGAVAAIEHIEHPISVARLVMERTPHVLLVGEGALQFALEQGFKRQNLLTPDAKRPGMSGRRRRTTSPRSTAKCAITAAPLIETGVAPAAPTTTTPSACWRSTRTAACPAPAPPAAWRGRCAAASATARSSAPACTWTARSAAPPPPAWVRK